MARCGVKENGQDSKIGRLFPSACPFSCATAVFTQWGGSGPVQLDAQDSEHSNSHSSEQGEQQGLLGTEMTSSQSSCCGSVVGAFQVPPPPRHGTDHYFALSPELASNTGCLNAARLVPVSGPSRASPRGRPCCCTGPSESVQRLP